MMGMRQQAGHTKQCFAPEGTAKPIFMWLYSSPYM